MIRKLKSTIEAIENLYTLIKKEINVNKDLKGKIIDLKTKLTTNQDLILLRNQNKINAINLKMNTNEGNVIFEDNFVNMDNFIFNNGLEVLPGKECLRIKNKTIEELIPKNIVVGYNNEDRNGVVTFEFAEEVQINFIDAFFRNSNGVKIKPKDIWYEYESEEGSLLENFERFFKRDRNDETDKYYFYTRKVQKVKFIFESSIEGIKYKEAITKFYLESFERENEAILKYENNSSSNKLKIVRNIADRFDTLKIEISSDGNMFSPLVFEKNIAFSNLEGKEIFLKIKQKTEIKTELKENQVEKKVIKHEVRLIDSLEALLMDPSKFIKNIKIRATIGTKKILSEYNKDICREDNGFQYIDDNFIELVETVDSKTLNKLKDLDDVSGLESINTPIFFFEKKTNKLYYPEFLTGDKENNFNMTFEFEEVIFQDVLSEDNYTPFIFAIRMEA